MMGWFGYGKKPENPILAQRRQSEQTAQERLHSQLQMTRINCSAMRQEIDELREEAKSDLRNGRRKAAAEKQMRLKELEPQLAKELGKLKNLEMQQKKVDTAHANLNQALLVEESATELEHIADAFEGIDLEAAADRVKEASYQLDEHDRTLSTPMFEGEIIDPDDIDADLAELQAEIDAETGGQEEIDLPSVPNRTDKPPVRVQMKKKI